MFPLNTNDERMLLKQVAFGDQEAFTLLFKKEHQKVNSFAFKLTRSPALSEEIVQDIFLKLWINRQALATVDNWGGYLNRIVRNHCFNVLRQLAQETSAAKEMRAKSTELDMDTEKGIDFRVTVKIINDAIAALPPQQQRVYSLCQHEGLKYAEAAERLNIAPGTVQAHMKQALRNIRKYVSRFAAIIF